MEIKNEKGLIVIPAYNEAINIGDVLRKLLDILGEKDFLEILVVNDGSYDDTEAIARSYGIYVLNHPCNIGYGAALQTGFKFACERDYDFVIIMDSDGQHEPKSIGNFLQEYNNADLVLGSRFLSHIHYPIDFFRKLGIWGMRKFIKILTRMRITDPTTGFQLIKKSALNLLAMDRFYPADFPDVDVIYKVWRQGFKIKEVPVVMYPRASGTSMHSLKSSIYYFARLFISILATHMEEK